MKGYWRYFIAGAAFAAFLWLIAYSFAHAGSDFGTEGGGNQTCITTNLPAGVWSLVSYDNAGQPCLTKPDADVTCDSSATWDWQLHGNLMLHTAKAQGPNTSYVEVQLWAGGGGGACHDDGGPAFQDNIICDNPATHYRQEYTYYVMPAFQGFQPAPFELTFYHLQPYFSTPADANYQGFWVFVRPSAPTVCQSTNYGDLVYKDEAN